MVILSRQQTQRSHVTRLKTQPDALRHGNKTSFPVFGGLSDCLSMVFPVVWGGVLLLPLVDGALTTSQRGRGAPLAGGFLFPAFKQDNTTNSMLPIPLQVVLEGFKAARSSPTCTIARSHVTLSPQLLLCTSEVIVLPWLCVCSGQVEKKKHAQGSTPCLLACLEACFSSHLLR